MPLFLLSALGQELLHRGVPEVIEGFGSTVAEDAHERYELGGRQVRQLTFLNGAKRAALKLLAILTYSDLMPLSTMNAPTALPISETSSRAKLPTTFFA